MLIPFLFIVHVFAVPDGPLPIPTLPAESTEVRCGRLFPEARFHFLDHAPGISQLLYYSLLPEELHPAAYELFEFDHHEVNPQKLYRPVYGRNRQSGEYQLAKYRRIVPEKFADILVPPMQVLEEIGLVEDSLALTILSLTLMNGQNREVYLRGNHLLVERFFKFGEKTSEWNFFLDQVQNVATHHLFFKVVGDWVDEFEKHTPLNLRQFIMLTKIMDAIDAWTYNDTRLYDGNGRITFDEHSEAGMDALDFFGAKQGILYDRAAHILEKQPDYWRTLAPGNGQTLDPTFNSTLKRPPGQKPN